MVDDLRSDDALGDGAPRRDYTHLDEARRDALKAMRILIEGSLGLKRAVLIDDLYGQLRVILWPTQGADEDALRARVDAALRKVGGHFWTGDIWISGATTSESDKLLYDAAWDEGTEVDSTIRNEVTDDAGDASSEASAAKGLRLDDRHRNRSAWFTRFREPLWAARRHAGAVLAGAAHVETAREDTENMRKGPPVVVFWSFKGGVGRTTGLAAFAIQRARAGEKVVIIDFDLDAPGAGTLLGADERGTIAPWGVVDYLLEQPFGSAPLLDYAHRCAREGVTGEGVIWVLPAGRLDDTYLTKLSRVDLEVTSPDQPHPLGALLDALCPDAHVSAADGEMATGADSPVNPDWILIDSRAGLSPAAGLLLSGFAHLHVLFGTTSEQSYQGLERVVHALGAERLREGMQADCLIVHAMVPDSTVVAKEAESAFKGRVEAIFRDHYLVPEGDDPDDDLWSVRDLDNAEAPHAPIPIPYRQAFGFFVSIDAIAKPLADEACYRELAARIVSRFPAPTPEGEAQNDGVADQ